MNAAWLEVIRQEGLVRLLGQIQCGMTTHLFGDRAWCGARV